MLTIDEKLKAAGNRPAGFDYLRLLLSISIIAWHGVIVCYGATTDTAVWNGPFGPVVRLLLPCFFALSGFLVAGSLYRNDLASFLTLRGLRIFPALAVEIFLSALIIGPLVTSLTLGDYFSNAEFYAYWGNLVGDVHFGLPGVFADLPASRMVNQQLWTIPYELECYLVIALFAIFGAHKSPRMLWTLTVALTVVIVAYQEVAGSYADATRLPGRILVLCFLFGTCLYSVRGRVPMNAWLFAGALGSALYFLAVRELRPLSALPVAYLTVYLGTLDPPRLLIIRGADYSYGLFLYGYPIQQLIAFLFPGARLWLVNVPAAIVVAGLCAALSWHFVELRVLHHRDAILAAVARLVRFLSSVLDSSQIRRWASRRVR